MFKPVSSKVDFPEMEREILKKWNENGTIEKYLHRNDSSSKRFSFLDGPITANNPMGVHHAWGRTYKDLWQRFWNMRGYAERFQPGFDCQGLWVEVEVEKELGIRNKKDIENLVPGNKKESIAKFVNLCKERVNKFSAIQMQQSKRLGFFMDWDKPYYTMSDENNYMIWHFLKTCNEKGWIYKGKDSVAWCPRCETAISQHEMLTEDYKEITHESIFIKFPIVIKGWENTYLLAWTTTPWTLPANTGVAIHPQFKYKIWENTKNGEKIIFISKDKDGNMPIRLLKKKEVSIQDFVFDKLDPEKHLYKEVKEISGKELLGLHYMGAFEDLPLNQEAKKERPNNFHKVVDGSEIATAMEGTGILHEAPGNGKEDFELAKKEGLPIIIHIGDDASFLEGMGRFTGKNAKKHPELIIDYLREFEDGRFLLKTMQYTHRYPACWRCKTELVWKIALEWYIAMDKPAKSKVGNKTLREEMIEVAKKIDWHPKFGLDRELDWLSNMHDWLISKKNRYWGLALPIFECDKCGHFEVLGSKEELKERAVAGWNEFSGHSPHKPFIDEVKIKCAKCAAVVSRLNDVGNVWLDAGIVPFSTFVDPKTKKLSYTTDKNYWREWFPASFITESFPGQFKNWFYSMIAMSSVLEQTNPFKVVLGFASALGEDGRPMHKSWGNSVEFNEGAERIGVDVMRWLYATADTEQNLLFGYKKADEVRRKFHLMLWNIYNFFVTYANIDGWKPDADKLAVSLSENILDKWVISRLHNTVNTVTSYLEKYNAQGASLAIELFVHDLSLWHIRRSRDRVGPSAQDGRQDGGDKNNFYETTYAVLITLSKLLAPFIPFISDEIYINLTSDISVHLADWPDVSDQLINPALEEEMANGRELASQVLMKRKITAVRVRIPLKKLLYNGPEKLSNEVRKIVQDEVNVQELVFNEQSESYEILGKDEDFKDISNQDVELGRAREIVRQIQDERKKLETKLTEKVDVVLPAWPLQHEEYIKRNALANSLAKGEFKVNRL